MSEFSRQFDVKSAEEALRLPDGAWFQDLLTYWRPGGAPDPRTACNGPADHLRLAIRDGYLNFYRAGQSVAKVSFARGKLQGEIHSKYVYGKDGGKEYVKIADVPYRDNLVHGWILEAGAYADKEKRFVDGMVAHHPGAIDLEAGLPADSALWDENSAPRMDLVTIEPCGDHYKLAFWEAKLVTNPEARCRNADAAPEVVNQLKKYQEWLAKNREIVCAAYRRCCEDLVKLHGIARKLNSDMPELGNAIVAVGRDASPLCVDGTPRLIIDAREGDSKFTQNGHLKKLQDSGICVQMVRTDMAMSAGA